MNCFCLLLQMLLCCSLSLVRSLSLPLPLCRALCFSGTLPLSLCVRLPTYVYHSPAIAQWLSGFLFMFIRLSEFRVCMFKAWNTEPQFGSTNLKCIESSVWVVFRQTSVRMFVCQIFGIFYPQRICIYRFQVKFVCPVFDDFGFLSRSHGARRLFGQLVLNELCQHLQRPIIFFFVENFSHASNQV